MARLGYDTRVTVLGHVQRGGTPSAFDRILVSIGLCGPHVLEAPASCPSPAEVPFTRTGLKPLVLLPRHQPLTAVALGPVACPQEFSSAAEIMGACMLPN